ncbi:hypothetical protein Tco_0487660 [Tanacetum coccineum]
MPVELGSFDAIIGMDWLAKYQAIIVCTEKIVRIPWRNKTLIIHGDGSNQGIRLNIISCTKTQKYMEKGFPIFLAHVTAKEVEDKSKKKRLEARYQGLVVLENGRGKLHPSYIYDCLQYSKLLLGTNHYLGLITFLVLLYFDSTKFNRFPVVRTRPAIRNWSSYLMKQRQELEHKDVLGILRLHNLISFNDDGNGDNDGDDDANDGDGNRDDEDGNLDDDGEGDKDPFRSNLSFGFSKMRLDDFGNGNGKSPNNLVVEKESVDPTVERTGELFGQNSMRMEVLNQGSLTPDRMPTHASTCASNVSPSLEKRIVKPSSYLLSPYMNKKTKLYPNYKAGVYYWNSLFAMQGDKIVYGVRLNMETLAPGLWINANVIDSLGAILNHEERFRDVE